MMRFPVLLLVALVILVLMPFLAQAQCPCSQGGPCLCQPGQCQCPGCVAGKLTFVVHPLPNLRPVYDPLWAYKPMPVGVPVRMPAHLCANRFADQPLPGGCPGGNCPRH